MANVAYVRVSSLDQNEARQVEALTPYNIDKWFCEKKSGKNTVDRTQFQLMMDYVREGDTVFIHDFSRLARSTKDMLEIVERLNTMGVHLISNKEKFDTSTPQGKFFLTVLAALVEFERTNLLERQREGIEIAKRAGKYKGGHKKKYDHDKFTLLYNTYMVRGEYMGVKVTKTVMAEQLGVSRATLNRIIEREIEKPPK